MPDHVAGQWPVNRNYTVYSNSNFRKKTVKTQSVKRRARGS